MWNKVERIHEAAVIQDSLVDAVGVIEIVPAEWQGHTAWLAKDPEGANTEVSAISQNVTDHWNFTIKLNKKMNSTITV